MKNVIKIYCPVCLYRCETTNAKIAMRVIAHHAKVCSGNLAIEVVKVETPETASTIAK